jgi:hypothetical protein
LPAPDIQYKKEVPDRSILKHKGTQTFLSDKEHARHDAISGGTVQTEEVRKLKGFIDRVDDWVDYASENGLFVKDEHDRFKEIQDHLQQARWSVNSDPSLSHQSVSCAIKDFASELRSAPRGWTLVNVYALDIWLYLIGVLAFVFLFYFFDLTSIITEQFGIPRIAVDAAMWGVVGGILRGLWKLWTRVNDRNFRQTWRIYFLSCPFLGGILGSIIYILIVAGLLVLSGSTEVKGENQQLIVMGFAGLAGYNWEWAIKRFDKIGEML